MTSLLAKSVKKTLIKAFPNTLIKEEEYVNYEGQRLFFDFYLPTLNLLIEVQGVQHTEFNKHFHGSAEAFKAQLRRDAKKAVWCHLNDMALVCINHDEIPIGIPELLRKIEEAQELLE